MGRLRKKETDYRYKEVGKRLKEQFINGINEKLLTAETKRELTVLKDMSEETRKQVLALVKRTEVQ